MAMYRLIVVLLLGCITLAVPALASDNETAAKTGAFFEALYDVPVMPGLEELKDQAVLFDKPDGRIASVTAASATLKEQDISAFYAQTLPQLGWKKSSENQYVRGKERLTMDVSRKPPLTVVHFALAPLK